MNEPPPSYTSSQRASSRRRSIELSRAVFALAVVIVALGTGLSKSPGPVIASAVSLSLIVGMLWRDDVPPILLLPVLFQWSEVAILPIATIWNGQSLNEMSRYNANWEAAAYFGLAGITALGFGMFAGAQLWRRRQFKDRLLLNALNWRRDKLLLACLSAIAAGYFLSAALSFAPGGLRQPIEQAANIKYLGIFALVYSSLINKRDYTLVATVICFDVVYGMTGFFAEFKFTILTFFVAAVAARPKFKFADIAIVGTAVSLVLAVAVFWSSVKADYRNFMNEGTGAQVVNVSLEARLSYLSDAAGSIDTETMSEGFDRLILRHGYLEFLALTMENVPANRPHERGTMSWAALSHIVMPRFLFPSKPALPPDTVVMARYTGLPLTWDTSKTSISLGNLTEMYIDFGFGGALLVEALLGFTAGFFSLKLMSFRKCPALISAGLCVMLVLPLAYFGTALPKLAGSFVYAIIITLLAQRYAVPIVLRWLGRWQRPNGRRTPVLNATSRSSFARRIR